MKTKAKSIFALAVLMICMSSCVYSLFPIYTDDTLVYLPELEGRWQFDNDPDNYMLFESAADVNATINVTDSDEANASSGVTITEKSFSIEYDGDEYIIEDGDTIRDKERVKAYYEKQMDSVVNEFGEAMAETLEKVGRRIKRATSSPGPMKYQSGNKAYKLTVKDGDDILKYQVHLAHIGDDLFMDLYPTDGDYTDHAFGSMVWFPVHTFMKIELDGDELRVIQFDLEKMNNLFESNLIRIGHENVDGTILITAKSEEIQKFLERYSKDESVFDSVETYNRVAQ